MIGRRGDCGRIDARAAQSGAQRLAGKVATDRRYERDIRTESREILGDVSCDAAEPAHTPRGVGAGCRRYQIEVKLFID
jgi:hypothetical protein